MENISEEHIDELLVFLPRFEDEDAQFVDRWIQDMYPQYSADVSAFFACVYQPWWNDFNYTNSPAIKKMRDEAFIKTAAIDDIKAMLTAIMRSERFGDGNWLFFLKKGIVQAILRRLAELRDSGEF